MGLDFTAIDFETANEQRGSVCAVGVAQVRDGAIVGAESWLVRPPTGDRFTNSHIHGIRPSHVRDAPTWTESLERIHRLSDERTLVAYNSPFDKGVYTAANRLTDAVAREYAWRDALALAKSRLDLPTYRLPAVVAHLGLDPFAHHEAGADAIACARVALALAERERAESVEALWDGGMPGRANGGAGGRGRSGQSARRAPGTSSRGTTNAGAGARWAAGAVGPGTSTRLPKQNPDADPTHVLFGVSLTFTGDLRHLSRPEAQALAAGVGAHVTSGPTRKTQVVVLGDFDPLTLKPGATVSSKVQKALDLRDAGQFIEFLSEAEFVAAVNHRGGRG